MRKTLVAATFAASSVLFWSVDASASPPEAACNSGTETAHATVPHNTEGNHMAHMNIPHCD